MVGNSDSMHMGAYRIGAARARTLAFSESYSVVAVNS